MEQIKPNPCSNDTEMWSSDLLHDPTYDRRSAPDCAAIEGESPISKIVEDNCRHPEYADLVWPAEYSRNQLLNLNITQDR